MNPFMRDELIKIAQIQDLSCFVALDKLANSMMGYNGMSAAGAQMTPPPNVSPGVGGVTNMPGMSMHCDKCFCEIKEVIRFCPKCGCRLKTNFDMKAIDQKLQGKNPERIQSDRKEVEDLETGPTGGEASEAEELAEGGYADTGKYAGVRFGNPSYRFKRKGYNPFRRVHRKANTDRLLRLSGQSK